MIFISSVRAYAIFTGDQYKPWPYFATFSHSTSVTYGRTEGRTTRIIGAYSIAVAGQKHHSVYTVQYANCKCGKVEAKLHERVRRQPNI